MTQINPNLSNKYNLKQKNPAFKSDMQNLPLQYQLPEVQNYQNPMYFLPGMQPQQEIPQEEFIQTPESQLPSLYYDPNYNKEPVTFKDTLKKADAFGAIYPWFEHPLLMGGTTVGTFWAFNKFTNAWSGEYEKSLLGKATKFGDNIANSRVFQNNTSKKVLGGIQSGWNKLGEALNKVQIFRAMKENPLKPEWPMAAYETITQDQRIISEDFRRIIDRLELLNDKDITIEKIGLKKSEHDVLKRVFNVQNLSEVSDEKQVIAALLKRLGKTDAEALQAANLGNASMSNVKAEIRNLMGASADRLEEIIKNCEKGNFGDEVLEIAKKAKGKVWVGEGEYSWLGKIFQPFKRYIGMDNVFNRMHSLRVGAGGGAQTKLGKIMSQAIQKIYRGFTFGGGKLGMLIFIVPHIVSAIMNTVKADREEKIGTAVQNGIGVFSWVFTIPLATQWIYKLGGIKNAGLGDRVAQIDALKESYRAGQYNGTRKQLLKEIKNLSKVDGQNLLTKMARKIAGFFTSDLGTVRPLANESLFVKLKGNLGNFLKNFGNVPIRFLAVMGLMGFLDSIINKTLSAIFGRSHDEMEVEAHAEEKKAQKSFTKEDLHLRLLNANQAKLAAEGGLNQKNIQQNQPAQPLLTPEQYEQFNKKPQDVVEDNQPQLNPNVIKTNPEIESLKPNRSIQQESAISDTNKKYVPNQNVSQEVLNSEPKAQKDNYAYIPTPTVNPEVIKTEEKTGYDRHSYIPSTENKLGKEAEAKVLNRYIPSQEAANVNRTFDNSGLEGAFARADRAEKMAIETLNGNFGRV